MLCTHITDQLTRHPACLKESYVRKQPEPPIKEQFQSDRGVQLHCHRHCWKVFAKHCHKNVMHADRRKTRVDNPQDDRKNFSRIETAGASPCFQQDLEEAN